MNTGRLFIIILILIGVLCPLLQAQQEATPQKPSGKKARPSILIKGTILDGGTGQGLEFATISIYNKRDSSIVGGGLSEADGGFAFSVKGNRLYAVAEFISYETVVIDPIELTPGKPIIDLGDIILSTSAVALDDVEIIAERSETTFSLDKKVFTVGKDLANRGGSAEDILNNVPSVDVDIDGVVSLRGNEGVRLLIDGKPSGMISSTNGLKNIPSNLIEKVEVITNPSARYEAEGMSGIINIVLKKNQGGGFNGAIDLSLGAPAVAGVSANLNYRSGALNWFANYGVNYNKAPGGGYNIQDQILDDGLNEYRLITDLNRDMNRKSFTNSFRFGADYFLSEKEQITAALLYRISDDDNISDLLYKDYSNQYAPLGIEPLWVDTDRTTFFDYDSFSSSLNQDAYYARTLRIDNEIEGENNQEYSLNYKKEISSRKHTIEASLIYISKFETEDNIFSEEAVQNFSSETTNRTQIADNEEAENTWTLQLDFVKPLGKDHKWEAGIRASTRNINTIYVVSENDIPLPGFDNSFDYDEDIAAAYAIYGNRKGNISYQAGLRGEYSFINTKLLQSESDPNKRNYFNLFPSGHISYHFNTTDALQVSYSRRINRPRFWDLNPFYTYSDSRNFFAGNPNLDPEYTDAYEISQIKFWGDLSLNTSLYYRKTTNTRQRALVLDKLTGTTVRIPINMGQTDDTGLDLTLSYTQSKWLRLSLNANIFNNRLRIEQSEILDGIYDFYTDVRGFTGDQDAFISSVGYSFNEVNNVTYNGNLTTRFSFWASDLQLRFNYRGPRERAQGISRAIKVVDIGWSKDFLKGKNLTLTLSAKDVFNSRRREGLLFLDEFFKQSAFQWRSRVVIATASYRINQKKKRGGGRPSNGSGGGY